MRKIDRTGESKISTRGLKMTVIRYTNQKDMDVEFENGYIAKNVHYANFLRGLIKNPYHPSVFDIGYIGNGDYPSWRNGEYTPQYRTWQNMLERCYTKKRHAGNMAYIGCETCSKWHNFQVFAKWRDENYYQIPGERICLDKDILNKGNRIYSPENCMFVPQKINLIFRNLNDGEGHYTGVVYDERYKRFIAHTSKNGKPNHLGQRNTPEEAFLLYKKAKEEYIRTTADAYRDVIPERVYEALYKYAV